MQINEQLFKCISVIQKIIVKHGQIQWPNFDRLLRKWPKNR